MGKRLMLLLALVFVAGITCAAYAEVQNVKVSGDIEMSTVYRNAFDLKGKNNDVHKDPLAIGIAGIPAFVNSYQTGTGGNIFIGQARVRVDADLTDNVSTTLRLISEWIWGQPNNVNGLSVINNGTDLGVNVDLAYVTLKEFLYSPLTLVVGRQELHYGNDMIIGDSDTNKVDSHGSIPGDLSKRKSFDAIRAILNYNPLTVDLVYSKVKASLIQGMGGLAIGLDPVTPINKLEWVDNRRDDDTDLFGINGKYEFCRKNATLEGYYWLRRIGPRYFYPIGDGTGPNNYKADMLHTIGGRLSLEPMEAMNFQLEVAKQFGQHNTNNTLYGIITPGGLSANEQQYTGWALETALGYTWKKVKYVPSLTALYAYFSGQAENIPGFVTSPMQSKSFRGWMPMYENQSYGAIANALLPQSNVQLVGLVGTVKPKDDITLKGEWYYYRFVDVPTSPWILADYYGNVMIMKDHRDAGNEFDVTMTYDYTDDVQFSLLGGLFLPGAAFADFNNSAATEVIGSMKVTF